jgi:hypothetical protein
VLAETPARTVRISAAHSSAALFSGNKQTLFIIIYTDTKGD